MEKEREKTRMEDGLKNKQLACEKQNVTTLREMVCRGIASKP